MSAYRPVPLPHRQDLSPGQALERAQAFRDEIARRHTVRHYSDRPVPREVIETCLEAAGTAPSGANQQPWHFAVIGPGPARTTIRTAAEAEERAFYAGRAGQAWLKALEPLGTDSDKPFLEIAPWLIVIFGERQGRDAEGPAREDLLRARKRRHRHGFPDRRPAQGRARDVDAYPPRPWAF